MVTHDKERIKHLEKLFKEFYLLWKEVSKFFVRTWLHRTKCNHCLHEYDRNFWSPFKMFEKKINSYRTSIKIWKSYEKI